MSLYNITLIDPATGSRLDTYDDELTEAQLADHLANAQEVGQDRYGETIYRFAEGWVSYITIEE